MLLLCCIRFLDLVKENKEKYKDELKNIVRHCNNELPILYISKRYFK